MCSEWMHPSPSVSAHQGGRASGLFRGRLRGGCILAARLRLLLDLMF
jgi:hypothetical protein